MNLFAVNQALTVWLVQHPLVIVIYLVALAIFAILMHRFAHSLGVSLRRNPAAWMRQPISVILSIITLIGLAPSIAIAWDYYYAISTYHEPFSGGVGVSVACVVITHLMCLPNWLTGYRSGLTGKSLAESSMIWRMLPRRPETENQTCLVCSEQLTFPTPATFCKTCRCWFHNRCAPSGDDRSKAGHCRACGLPLRPFSAS
jgi:hypothetical protein